MKILWHDKYFCVQHDVPEVDRKPMAGGNYYQNIVRPLITYSRQNMTVTHIHLSLTENELCVFTIEAIGQVNAFKCTQSCRINERCRLFWKQITSQLECKPKHTTRITRHYNNYIARNSNAEVHINSVKYLFAMSIFNYTLPKTASDKHDPFDEMIEPNSLEKDSPNFKRYLKSRKLSTIHHKLCQSKIQWSLKTSFQW